MVIRGNNRERIDLHIKGDLRKDDNWLEVQINVQTENINWKASDKCLRLGEVKDLITWLEKINRNENLRTTYKDFLENEISFELTTPQHEELKIIRLILGYNLLPENHYSEEEKIDITVKSKELKRIIKDLKAEIQ